MVDTSGLDGPEQDLVSQVVAACQAAIDSALANPAEAVGLAAGLNSALSTLTLVQTETGKGTAGLQPVVANADALTRAALADVLKWAPNPHAATKALAGVDRVAPRPARDTEPVPPIAAPVHGAPSRPQRGRGLPTFGEVSLAYIEMRLERDGGESSDIGSLRMRRRTFIELIGDRAVDEYYPRDLQSYVAQMQFWPANATKTANFKEATAREIIEANRDRSRKPISLKSLQDGYVANIRTMMRHGMADHDYRDPFAGAKISWPNGLARSRPREGIGVDVRNRVFRNGVSSGRLDEAVMPLLATLTGRRLAILLYLQGSDIREKHGVWIAQTSGIVSRNGVWTRVPIKTGESMTFFVLHALLVEIGFVDWARRQDGFLFAEPHLHTDPAKYVSKTMNRLLRASGAEGRVETFHSMRGDRIDDMREEDVDARARRLQARHELGDEHEQYGHRALNAAACRRLANLPLDPEIDWSVFRGLDFDALAAGRRLRGRRPTKES